jgi:hypothetical protein
MKTETSTSHLLTCNTLGQESCFYEDITSQTPVQLMFEVSKGAQLDIDVTVSASYSSSLICITNRTLGERSLFTSRKYL